MVSPGEISQKITLKYNEKSLRELKYYMRKYSLNWKESSKGGIEEQKKIWDILKTKNEISDINLNVLITLNANGLNNLSKSRDCQIGLKKQNLTICYRWDSLDSKTQIGWNF